MAELSKISKVSHSHQNFASCFFHFIFAIPITQIVLLSLSTAPIDPPYQRSFKIQRPSSGGDLPQFRRVNSNTLTMFMDNDVEEGNLGPYADRPRVFPNMRSKVHTPLIFWILMGINVHVLLVFLLLGLGAIFYVGAKTSPIIVFVFSICVISFLFSIHLTKWVLAKDEGPPEMVQINLE
ncbi:hypothetical protein SO802_008013 [Lithocarpus litseifolius]|uniref:Uncharacterized protein n=1 Tax=Lithocarpus litseifolius TaxID=425828 RepID=A0AAW2DUB2_9ROSI